MKLASVLAEELINRDWTRLYVPIHYLGSMGRVLQRISVDILLGRVCICPSTRSGRVIGHELNIELMSFKGSDEASAEVVKAPRASSECICEQHLKSLAPRTPLFIIDLLLWNEHYDDEKRELIEQILVSLSIIRNYLWDECLVITNANPEFQELFSQATQNMRIQVPIYTFSTSDYLSRNSNLLRRSVVLDPYADIDLSEDSVRYKVFIIGGILDKGNRLPRATERLYYLQSMDRLGIPRRRIALRGSVMGVPERINRIVEIVLKHAVEGLDLEEAILSSMTKSDKIARAIFEAQRIAKYNRSMNAIMRELTWLGMSENEIKKIIKRYVLESSED